MTGYYNHAFFSSIFYNLFLFIIEIPALLSSVGVLQYFGLCSMLSCFFILNLHPRQNTVRQQLFSLLQTLLQIFRDVTKTSFTFKDSCSFTQHAYCAFVYKIGAAFPESVFTKLVCAQQHYIEFHSYLELSVGSYFSKGFTLLTKVTYR